jgi:CheY-like chemotaxis protein
MSLPSEHTVATRQHGRVGPRDNLRVLVVEDNPVNRALVVSILTKRGHRVAVAENGRQAVEAVARESFDAIIMDVQMPEMDGLEATRTIRGMELSRGGRLPIIALTAHAMKSDRDRCIAAGMDYYLTKPVRSDALYETLQTAVTTHARVDAADATDEAPEVTSEPLSFDPSPALAATGGDLDLLAQLVAVFREERPKLIRRIRDGVAAGDATAVARAAHTLKGSAGIFGETGPFELARSLEHDARDGNLSEAERIVASLESALERLENDLMALVPRS